MRNELGVVSHEEDVFERGEPFARRKEERSRKGYNHDAVLLNLMSDYEIQNTQYAGSERGAESFMTSHVYEAGRSSRVSLLGVEEKAGAFVGLIVAAIVISEQRNQVQPNPRVHLF